MTKESSGQGFDGPDLSWKSLYRAGGISAVLIGVLYIVATILVFVIPFPPTSGGAATLQYIASNRSAYIVQQVLYNAPGILAILSFLALYVALKHLDKSYAAIGAAVSIASQLSFLAFNVIFGLVYLSDEYAAATTDAQRAIFATAAEALVAQNNIVFANGVVAAVGILIVSLVMLKGLFRKSIAYLGIVTGVLGIVSEGARTIVGAGYLFYGILLMIWFIVIGWQLYLLGRN
jgi:hypothetical protein